MDGDEPPNSRRNHHNSRSSRNNNHLRRHDKGRGHYIDENGNLISPLHPKVYISRIQQDEVIRSAIKTNKDSRYHELITKNDGRDVESQLREWIGEKLREEAENGLQILVEKESKGKKKKFKNELSDDDKEEEEGNGSKEDNSNEDDGTEEDAVVVIKQKPKAVGISSQQHKDNQKQQHQHHRKLEVTSKHNKADNNNSKSSSSKTKEQQQQQQKQKSKQTLAAEEKMKELDELPVYHFPRNASGYYRGLWIRTPNNKTYVAENDGKKDNNGNSKDKKEDDKTTVEKEATNRALKKKIKTTQTSSTISTVPPPPQNVTVDEIHAWTQKQLHKRKSDVGILFLRPNMYLEPPEPIVDENATTATSSTKESKSAASAKRTSGLGQSTSSTSNKGLGPPSISLTKEAGRAAFQLYSRPIPAMNEISIVDGLVKLYDGMTTSFVSRRTDVLLRVRGVMIHGVGKLSLVTAPTTSKGVAMGRRRSVLAVREVDDGRVEEKVGDDKSKEVEDDTDEGGQEESEDGNLSQDEEEKEEESIDQRRRRLEETVNRFALGDPSKKKRTGNDDFDSTNEEDSDMTAISQIRTEVLDMYSSLFNNDAQSMENELDFKQSMKKNGWTLLHSVDGEESLFDGEEEENTDNANQNDDAVDIQSNDPDDVDSEDGSGSHHSQSVDSAVEFVPRNSSIPVQFNMTDNDNPDIAFRRSVLTVSTTEEQSVPLQYEFGYPYAIDDVDDSIKKAKSPASRTLPAREAALVANAANCEFEINIDVKETKWTFGEWRASMEHRLRMGGVFNPYWNIGHSGKDDIKLKRSQYLLVMKSQLDFLEEQTPKEALVMTMVGDIDSKDCEFHSFVNVTAMRTNWEHTTAKAINYSFYMMLTCLTQIVILLRQLLHTQSQSVATNVSLLCIGWQTVLDAIMCISHIFLCLVMQPLFTAFASVAFFKLLIFCVIEMKYMAIIIQARNNANNTGLSQEDLRRQITLLHIKFYAALMSAILAFWYFGQTNRTLYVLLLYSFWVPQIILNIVTESRKPMHPYYMYGMSISRSIAPIYVFAVRNNFLKEVNPDFPTEPKMCQLLILWIAIQTAILFAQSKYGTRFMIPQR